LFPGKKVAAKPLDPIVYDIGNILLFMSGGLPPQCEDREDAKDQ